MTLIRPDAWKLPWYGKLIPHTIKADDNRLIEFGAAELKDLPMPLDFQVVRDDGHKGAVTVGAIDSVADTPEGLYAVGRWLDPSAVPEVNRALALVDAGVCRPSVDLTRKGTVAEAGYDEAGNQVTSYLHAKVGGATIVSLPAFDGTFIRVLDLGDDRVGEMRQALMSSGFVGDVEDGPGDTFALTGTTSWSTIPVAVRDSPYNSDEAYKAILEWAGGDERKASTMFLWRDPREAIGFKDRYKLPIGTISNGKPVLVYHAIYSASALVSGAHGGLPDVPEGDRAKLRGVISEIYARMAGVFNDPNLRAPWDERAKRGKERIVSSAGYPVAPHSKVFADPALKRPTKITVTKGGRVFGHLAVWGTCHRGLGQLTGECVTPPRAGNGYGEFHTGQVLTADGELVDVGRITVDTTHPLGRYGANLNATAAAAHYDRTGACAAVVRAGEDEYGIWVAGIMVPEADERTAAKLRRHPLSGDWRAVDGRLKLVAALAVNTPGFPILQFAAAEDGSRAALVASADPGCLDEADEPMIDAMSGENNEPAGQEPPAEPGAEPAANEPAVDVEARMEAWLRGREERAAAVQGRRERLATLATVDWGRRVDRLRSMPERIGDGV